MRISGLQKLTLLDYPGSVACIIFTQGCNFACSFCHNSELIPLNSDELIPESEILEFLKKRKNILDGVVISGGEPTIQSDLKNFIKKIKNMGYKVKLDTNGTNPIMLEELINDELLDYIAMDIKITFDDYEKIIKTKFNKSNILKSIDIIKNVNHEYRTTIIKSYHDLDKIKKIYKYIGPSETLYLQNFEMKDTVLDKSLESYTKEELKNLQIHLKDYPNIRIRGL